MRSLGVIAIGAVLLGGCSEEIPSLLSPMEPSREAVAASRRPLTDDEKGAISNAISARVKGPGERQFRWPPLVRPAGESVATYCGLVNGAEDDERYRGNSKFSVRLSYDPRGRLKSVDVVSIARSKPNALPTSVDSLCNRSGYVITGSG